MDDTMHSEWKVTSQFGASAYVYAVYRLRDITKIQYHGNMEYATEYMENREEATAIADKLNQEAEK